MGILVEVVILAALRLRKPLLVLVAVLTALGVWSCLSVPQSIFPPVGLSRIEVFAYAGDLPPEEMRTKIAIPLQNALRSLPVLNSRSYSNQGAVEIELDFDPASDAQADQRSVDAVIAAIRPSLPAIARIETVIYHPNIEPVVSYALVGTTTAQAQLRHLVEQRLARVFTGQPGLGRLTVFGGPDLEVRVALDSKAMSEVGTTPAEVARAIGRANTDLTAAAIDQGDQRQVLFAGRGPSDAASLGAVLLPDRHAGGLVPLSRIAEIALAPGPATQQASFDGAHAVILNAYPAMGASAVDLRDGVAARVQRLMNQLPPDVHATRYWDQTRLIVASQESLRDAIVVGALLSVAVIFAFLRGAAITLVAGAMIPVAIAVTILVMARSGMSLNLMSLGGLAIAVGLIIDEVIVVVEAVGRELGEAPPGAPRRPVIARAAGRVARPLLAATAANLVVLLPLTLLSDIPGFFFRELAVTLAIALVVSVALSLLVVPAVTEVLLGRRALPRPGLPGLGAAYARLLGRALGHRWLVYLAAAGVLAATAGLANHLETDFLPHLEEGQFEIKYTLAPGLSLAAADRQAADLEKIVVADGAVAHEGRLTGIDTNGLVPTALNAGTIRVALRHGGEDGFDTVAERLRKRLAQAAPQAEFEFHQLLEDQINDLTGAPEPLQVAIIGPDQDKLVSIAEALGEELAKVPGIVDLNNGVVDTAQVIRVIPRTGVPEALEAGALAQALGGGLGGVVATQLQDDGAALPVRVGLAAAAPALDSLPITTAAGPRPLTAIADIGEPVRSSKIFDRVGVRMLLMTAGIRGPLSPMVVGMRAAIAKVPVPPDYLVKTGGTYRQQQQSFGEFGRIFEIAVPLVFFILLAAFDSFLLPLVVLATIPLSPIGMVLALWLTGTPINVSSIMGLLLLAGIVVRNGILLIDGANRRRRQGAEIRQAVLEAAAERLRPILMMTFAAISALLPVALGAGSGSEMLRPLAISVIGGLTTATAFTLVLIPVLYSAIGRWVTPPPAEP